MSIVDGYRAHRNGETNIHTATYAQLHARIHASLHHYVNTKLLLAIYAMTSLWPRMVSSVAYCYLFGRWFKRCVDLSTQKSNHCYKLTHTFRKFATALNFLHTHTHSQITPHATQFWPNLLSSAMQATERYSYKMPMEMVIFLLWLLFFKFSS